MQCKVSSHLLMYVIRAPKAYSEWPKWMVTERLGPFSCLCLHPHPTPLPSRMSSSTRKWKCAYLDIQLTRWNKQRTHQMREAWGFYLASVRSAGAVRHNVHTKLSLEKNKQITLLTSIQLSPSYLIEFLTFSKIPRRSKQPVLVNVNLTRGFFFGYSCFLHHQNGLSPDTVCSPRMCFADYPTGVTW